MALHLLHNPLRFMPLVATFTEGDAIILFDQALQQWADLDAHAVRLISESVCALSAECEQTMQKNPLNGVKKISFDDWVELAIEHPQQVNWV